MAQFKTPAKMKIRPAGRGVPQRAYTPPADSSEDERPKGSIVAGFLWSALFMFVGFVVGVKFHEHWLGLGLGVLTGFLVAQGKHKGRGVVGFVIALLLVGGLLSMSGALRDSKTAEREAYERSRTIRY